MLTKFIQILPFLNFVINYRDFLASFQYGVWILSYFRGTSYHLYTDIVLQSSKQTLMYT